MVVSYERREDIINDKEAINYTPKVFIFFLLFLMMNSLLLTIIIWNIGSYLLLMDSFMWL